MKWDGGLYRWRHEDDFKYKPDIEFPVFGIIAFIVVIVTLTLLLT